MEPERPSRIPVPRDLGDVDADWLGAVLRDAGARPGARLREVEVREIGAGRGFLSTTAVARLHCDGPVDPAPASVVVKLEPRSEQGVGDAREMGAFEREVRFYRDASRRTSMRLPRLYHAEVTDERSVLVLEDLSHLDAGDQVHGLPHVRVVATAREIARLHAAYWDPALLRGIDWAPDHDRFWELGFAEHWPAFAREYELRIGRDALRLGETLVERLDWLEQRIAERPCTLIHDDLRADNLLFGEPDGEQAAVVLDWQLVTKSLAAIDPTRLLGGSEPPAERRGHQMEIFGAWHETLLLEGITDYPFEEALYDFRLGVLFNLLVPIRCFAWLDATSSRRQTRLADGEAERMFASALELDAGSILP